VKVNLFITCLTDTLYPQTGIAKVKMLERLGCEVEFPRAQTCCDTGYQPEALELIRNLVNVFEHAEVVVAPSGSCVAMIRELSVRAAEWSHDHILLERVKDLASRTFELSEFLVNTLKFEDVGAYYPHRVTYHPTCHAMRVTRLRSSCKTCEACNACRSRMPTSAAGAVARLRSRMPKHQPRCSPIKCAIFPTLEPRSAPPGTTPA
jgi:Fe-S oxidoreductase